MIDYIELGEVAKIDRSAASAKECAELPYIGLEHIEKDTGHFAAGYKPRPEALLATKFRFTPKHVLYGKLRPYLNKVLLPSFDGVCTTEILPILPNERKLDQAYLWAYLLSPEFVSWASESVSGANLPRLDPKLLADHPIPLPPLAEQRRIAAILARADRLRRLRRYALELSAGYLQAVFVEMFGDLSVNAKEWETFSLEDVSDIASGVTKGQKYNGKVTTEVPYLRVANVQDGYLDLTKIKMIAALPEDVEALKLQPGDIVMTEGGDFDKLGRGATWRGELDLCIHQNHIFRVRLERATVRSEYFETFLLTRHAKLYFLQSAKQTTNLATINMTQLRALPVQVPPLALQERFAAIARRHERLRGQQREALRQAEQLFGALLGQAFRGELGEAAGAAEVADSARDCKPYYSQ